jgi:hypothetical protein
MKNLVKAALAVSGLAVASFALSAPATAHTTNNNVGAYFGPNGLALQFNGGYGSGGYGNSYYGSQPYYAAPYRSYPNYGYSSPYSSSYGYGAYSDNYGSNYNYGAYGNYGRRYMPTRDHGGWGHGHH